MLRWTHVTSNIINRVFAENLFLVGFLAVCFLYKINPNQRKIACRGKKLPKCHFSPIFSWVGLALGWVVSSVSYYYLYVSNPTEIGNSQTPHCEAKRYRAVPQLRRPRHSQVLWTIASTPPVSCLITFRFFGCLLRIVSYRFSFVRLPLHGSHFTVYHPGKMAYYKQGPKRCVKACNFGWWYVLVRLLVVLLFVCVSGSGSSGWLVYQLGCSVLVAWVRVGMFRCFFCFCVWAPV